MSLIIGVDGGGTNTRGVIADLKGNILAEASGAGSNYQTRGLSPAVREIKSVILGLIEEANARFDSVEEIVAGLAGVGRPTDRERLKRRLVGELPDEIGKKIYITTDLHVALYGAVGRGEGLIVNAGTGATAMGKDKSGEIERADGWGFLLGDEGSGFWIGLEAMKAALKSSDNRGQSTELEELIRRHFSRERTPELLNVAYGDNGRVEVDRIAGLSPLVFDAAENGDGVAENIIVRAGEELAHTTYAVVDELGLADQRFPLVLSGGVFDASYRRLLVDKFTSVLDQKCPGYELTEPDFPPEVGSLFIGLRVIHGELASGLLSRVEESWKGMSVRDER